jgi:hypothetical protein
LHLSKLLPETYNFKKPNSILERRLETARLTNFYILTCSSETCIYKDTEKQHDSKKLFSDIIKQSFTTFSAQSQETWQTPDLSTDIFDKNKPNEALFTRKIPTEIFDCLADQAENYACQQNSVRTNSKRRNYYFYKFLNLYYQAAAYNHNIQYLTKQEALNNLTPSIVDTLFLARIITYFDIIKTRSPTYSQITKHFKEQALPEAEKFLFEKFQFQFKPVTFTEALFLSSTPFQ